MKQTKTSCRNAIIRWYAAAFCGTGVSLEVFQEHYGGSQTKENLNGITKTQVQYIFECMWDGVDGDNLAAGLDLFLTAVAMHADVSGAVGMLQDICGIPQTGIMTTKLPAIALAKGKVPVLDGLIRECAKRNVPVFSGIKEQAYKMMGAGYKLTDPMYEVAEPEMDSTTQKERAEFKEMYDRFCELAERLRKGQITVEQNGELTALNAMMDKSRWRWDGEHNRVVLKEPHHYPAMEAHPSSPSEERPFRCCGNCAWRDKAEEIPLQPAEGKIVCGFNTIVAIRQENGKCHHHAFTTGWIDEQPDGGMLMFGKLYGDAVKLKEEEVALPYDKLRDDLAAAREKLAAAKEEIATTKRNMAALGAKLVELRKAQSDK